MRPDDKIRVKRVPKRGVYEREDIYQILDKHFLCHCGFSHDGYPVVIPTLFGRKGDYIYLHGSAASRMIRNLSEGVSFCLSVASVQGLVLSKSAFHHSVNYESAVVFGTARVIEDDAEKMDALECISDQVIRNRWNETRIPNKKELKATAVLKMKIEDASGKVRTGGPVDDKEDLSLDVWSGVVPIHEVYGEPIEEGSLKKQPIPLSISNLMTS